MLPMPMTVMMNTPVLLQKHRQIRERQSLTSIKMMQLN